MLTLNSTAQQVRVFVDDANSARDKRTVKRMHKKKLAFLLASLRISRVSVFVFRGRRKFIDSLLSTNVKVSTRHDWRADNSTAGHTTFLEMYPSRRNNQAKIMRYNCEKIKFGKKYFSQHLYRKFEFRLKVANYTTADAGSVVVVKMWRQRVTAHARSHTRRWLWPRSRDRVTAHAPPSA